MASLSIQNNLTKGIYKISCKYGQIIKEVKFVELNTKIVSFVLTTQKLKMI